MLPSTCFFIYIILTCSAQLHLSITNAHHKEQEDLNFKSHTSSNQYLAMRNRSRLKLTFQTLYPEFISNWTTLKNSGTNKHTMNKLRQDIIRPLSTNKRQEPMRPTRGRNNGFIEVESMMPYVPRKVMIPKNLQNHNLKEPRQPIRRSGLHSDITQMNLKQHRGLSLEMSTIEKTIETPDSINPLQPLQAPHKGSRRNSNPSAINKQVLARLEQLESNLKVMKTKVKNDTQVIENLKTKVQEKESLIAGITSKEETNSFDLMTATRVKSNRVTVSTLGSKVKMNDDGNKRGNGIKNKMEIIHDFRFRNDRVNTENTGRKTNERQRLYEENYKKVPNTLRNRGIHNTFKDPLDYGSLDLHLEDESTLKEYSELRNRGALPAVKPTMNHRRSLNEEPLKISKRTTTTKEVNLYIPPDNANQGTRIFAPEPNKTYNITISDVNKSKDEISFADFVENMKTIPPRELLANMKASKKNEELGRKRLDSLNLPGLNSTFADALSNNDLYHFDQVNLVDSIMGKNSVPLLEKRNALKMSMDQRMAELFKRHNMKVKMVTQDHLDPLIKSVAATLRE